MKRTVPANWPAIRFAVFKRDAFTCQHCLRVPDEGHWLEPDHIIPVSCGGSDDPSNLLTTCDGCNYSKGAKFGVPAHLCSAVDADGYRTWKSWGQWSLQFDDDSALLVFQPGRLDYWISFDRWHEADWEAHIRRKPWAQTAGFEYPIRPTSELETSWERRWREQDSGLRRPLFQRFSAMCRDLALDEAEYRRRYPWLPTGPGFARAFDNQRHPAGQPYYDFVEAIAFGRRLVDRRRMVRAA